MAVRKKSVSKKTTSATSSQKARSTRGTVAKKKVAKKKVTKKTPAKKTAKKQPEVIAAPMPMVEFKVCGTHFFAPIGEAQVCMVLENALGNMTISQAEWWAARFQVSVSAYPKRDAAERILLLHPVDGASPDFQKLVSQGLRRSRG